MTDEELKVPSTVVTAEVHSGRRWQDWHVITSNGSSVFFWLFGWLLDERRKPSMSRMMLAAWTWVGWVMIRHELLLAATVTGLTVRYTGQVPLGNAVWQAWWAAEGFLALAVFGPRIASYFGAGAAGAVTGLGQSIRDDLSKVSDVINKAHHKEESTS